MNNHRKLTVLLLSLLPLSVSFGATSEQCYSYFTELVRSSNYPFSEWGVKSQKVNLVIDEDDASIIRAKLVIDSDGTGTIGWVVFNKNNSELFDTTTDSEKPSKLSYNNEYVKAQKYCLLGEVLYRVESKERLYFFDKTDAGFKKTSEFIINGDYVHQLEKQGNFSEVVYQNKSGRKVTGWVNSVALRKIDFKNTW